MSVSLCELGLLLQLDCHPFKTSVSIPHNKTQYNRSIMINQRETIDDVMMPSWCSLFCTSYNIPDVDDGQSGVLVVSWGRRVGRQCLTEITWICIQDLLLTNFWPWPFYLTSLTPSSVFCKTEKVVPVMWWVKEMGHEASRTTSSSAV